MHGRNVSGLFLALELAAAIGCQAAFASLPAPPPDPLSIALAKGDVDAVHRVEDQLNVHADTRALDNAQLHYDLPSLLRLSINYEEVRFRRGTPGDLLLALRANSLARASALGLGDAHTFLQEAIKAKRDLLPALTKSIGGVNTFDNGLDTADLDGALLKAPKVSATWHGVTASFPFPGAGAPPVAAKPSIKIDGHQGAVTIATNRPTFAPVWIITSPGDRKSLGLTLLVKNIGSATATFHSRSYTSQIDLYLARSVEFGPLVLRNVAVVVMQSDFLPPETVVGMPMLRKFGEVTFADNRMVLARTGGDEKCDSGAPLTLASGPDLNGDEFFPASIGGKSALTDFVSDSPIVVGVRPDFGQGISHGTRVDFAVGSWSLRHPAVVPSSWTGLRDAVLGNGVLKDNIVRFRFDKATPSICIAKATRT